MTSEYDNEETGDIVESEAADSDDKTKTVSSVSELILRHNAVSGIFWFQAYWQSSPGSPELPRLAS